jgi:excinuclease ABC subunit B
MEYSVQHGIVPQSIQKTVRNVIEATRVAEENEKYFIRGDKDSLSVDEIEKLIVKLTKEMKSVATDMQFERAAELRDKIVELKKKIG